MKQLIMEMKRKFERVPLTEKAKPDYLDFDGDGNKEEPMVNALENSEQCTECEGKGCEHCDGKGYHEKVDEMSTTAGIAVYNTPNSFITPAQYEKKKKTMKYERVQEAMDRKYEQLIEGYRTYATSDPKKSPESKVNETIIEVSKKLREIEESVKNASRLKEESGVTREGYKKRTNKALDAISERLVKISERVRNLMQ